MSPIRHRFPTRCCPLLLAFVLGAAGPILPRSSPESAPPLFLIETITVEGLGAVSADIVLSTSLLREGETYSERQLRDAISRIVRLPLVLDAELALRRGSERGRFELVITVWEARRWFFSYEMESIRWRDPLPGVTGMEHDERDVASLAGRRFSVGRHGVFFLAVDSLGFSDVDGFEISPEVGYTHYNLFGRHVLFNVSYSLARCDDRTPEPGRMPDGSCDTNSFDLGLDPTFGAWSSVGDTEQVALSLGVPLRGNQSLHLFARQAATDEGLRTFALEVDFTSFTRFEDRIDHDFSVSWVFDSVDDIVFPTAGTFIDAGLVWRSRRADLSVFTGPPPFGNPPALALAVRAESDELRLRANGERHWPVAEKGTVWVGGRLSVGRSQVMDLPLPDQTLIDDHLDLWGGAVRLGYGRFLKRVYENGRWREVRWETELELFHESTSPGFVIDTDAANGFRLSTGIGLRNTWGVFRWNFQYLDLGTL